MILIESKETSTHYIKTFKVDRLEDIKADTTITKDFITISLKTNKDTKNIVFDKDNIKKDNFDIYNIAVYIKDTILTIEAKKLEDDISFPINIDIR